MIVFIGWELLACARQQFAQYGGGAATQAAMRCDALLADGDQPGHHAWLTIFERVAQLNSAIKGEVRH